MITLARTIHDSTYCDRIPAQYLVLYSLGILPGTLTFKRAVRSPVHQPSENTKKSTRFPADPGKRSSHAAFSLNRLQHFQTREEPMDCDTIAFSHAENQTRGQESGAILECHDQDCVADDGSRSTVDGSQDAHGDSDADSKTGDAMMDYSQSCPPIKDSNLLPQNAVSQESRPQTLANLPPEALQLQRRYFHTTKTLNELDLNGLVKCLVCAREGHLAEACERLTCAVCGKRNEHFSQHCPQRKRCQRCREIGHQSSNCHHKLAASRSEITCDWCQRVGHVEEECELLWRTSGRPWESEYSIRTTGLGCYECGGAGHLGNDCPTRRPGKPMGTSTWSSAGKYQTSSGSQDGMVIKGRAKRQESIELDYGDDDSPNFIRPKIPAPTPRGQINIASQSFSNSQPGSWTGNNVSYPGNHIRGSQGVANRNGRPAGEYPSTRDQGQYSYRSSNRRSVSPQYAIRGSYGGIDKHKPPLPPKPPTRIRKTRVPAYRPIKHRT